MALQITENGTLRLYQRIEQYDTPTVSDLIDLLSECRHLVRDVDVGAMFLDSLSLAEKLLVLEELGEFKSLQQLEFQGSGGTIPLRGLSALLSGTRTSLQVLRLNRCQLLGNDNHGDLHDLESSLTNHPELQEFSLVTFDVVQEDGQVVDTNLDGLIQALCTVSKLNVLRLESSAQERCTFVGNSMAPLFKADKLQELHLSHFKLGTMHLRMLAWAIRKEPLQKLSLKFAHLDDDDLSKLAFYLGKCKQLQELDFSGNDFGDAGCIALADGLSTSQSLATLTLLDNKKIGPDGYGSLGKMLLRNTNIQGLHIPPRQYNDTMQRALEKNRRNTKAALAA